MHLIVGIILVSVLGLIPISQQHSIAKHSSSSNEDKKTSDQTTTKDESNHLSNERESESAGDSTRVPTVGNVVIPLLETIVQQQNTVTPQVIQAVHTEYLENSLNTISTQADNINDNTLPIQLNNSTQWRNLVSWPHYEYNPL